MVSAFDAGAANHLAAILEAQRASQTFLSVSGPAKKIFGKNHKKFSICKKHKSKTFKTVITGTGWQTSWEHRARQYARNEGAYLISLIDHWSNYQERFSWKNETILPDEIWVTDIKAFKKCKQIFPQIKTCLIKNFYLNKILQQIKKIKTSQKKTTYLYLTEPIRNAWGNLKIPGEKLALIQFLKKHKKNAGKIIIIKIHPSESIQKYKKWCTKREDIILTKKLNLSEAIAKSQIVYGCYSYALFIAKCAGKKVKSAIPKIFNHIKVDSL